MKGPFFVKDDEEFTPAPVCANCMGLTHDETCFMEDCPFMEYSTEEKEEQ